MAKKHGLDSLKVYHKTGPLRFFYDYMTLYRSSEAIPQPLRLDGGLETQVEAWLPQWTKVYTPWVRRLWIDEHTDFKAVGARLEALFGESGLRPNFLQPMFAANRYFYCNGKEAQALESARIASRLYPRSVVPLVMRANTLLAFGKDAEAATWYEKAKKIDPKAGVLSEFSFFVAAAHMEVAGNFAGAEKMLRKGLDFHPGNPRLHDGIAQIYLMKAKKHLRKALDTDPTFEAARKRLKRLD